MTQLEAARQGIVTAAMQKAAEAEAQSAEAQSIESMMKGLVDGTVVIPANVNHSALVPRGIGAGLRTKVNANIGTSQGLSGIKTELKKLQVACRAGADAVMDLSTGGDVDELRRRMLAQCSLPFGTVPIYQCALEARETYGSIVQMDEESLFKTLEKQAQDGVDFMTVHSGLTLDLVEQLKENVRTMNIVSRGGSFLVGWMLHNGKENPFYSGFDRILETARRYDVTLSLGDGMRPGCLADATDEIQIRELMTLGRLVRRAREAGVQVMVEGPGHVPMDQIAANVILQKRLCDGAPFYVLGPLVTDVAPGYDHITSAIGGAIAAAAGADFLCYVTPAEHLGLPDLDDVRDGVIASKIAAHAADIAKRIPGAAEWDRKMAVARKALDWEAQAELALNPERVRSYGNDKRPDGTCTMCGPFCAMKITREALGIEMTRC